MEYEFTCKYCGKCWKDTYFSGLKYLKCISCNDTNVRIRELDNTSRDCFGYEVGQKLDKSFLKE